MASAGLAGAPATLGFGIARVALPQVSGLRIDHALVFARRTPRLLAPAPSSILRSGHLTKVRRLAGAAECIAGAVARGNRSHMSVTRPTSEGDPIQTVYAVGEDGTVIVSTDTTRDRFGDQGVVRQACTRPKVSGGELLFDDCRPD